MDVIPVGETLLDRVLDAARACRTPSTIRGWLPPHFIPPQVTMAPAAASAAIVMMRPLGAAASASPISGDDVVYWRNDVF